MENMTKSIIMTTAVVRNARSATIEAMKDPTMPAPRASMKAMKLRAQAMGWRTIAFVSLRTVTAVLWSVSVSLSRKSAVRLPWPDSEAERAALGEYPRRDLVQSSLGRGVSYIC